ncbi:MAG TPA: VOC family protein [Phenylobacterium sp.]|nr:VOC family protein [Phenylobacterium sp.]
MSDSQGRFIWYELMTPDVAGAKAFYGKVAGWGAQDMPMGDGPPYTVLDVGGAGVGGIDAAAGRVKAAGGQVVNGPMEAPSGDWVLQATDPQGAMFALTGVKDA